MDAVHESEVESTVAERDGFAFERRKLGGATDGEALGCSLYVVPPGERAWPYHYHTANEEAIYVLAGAGELRGPDDERVPLEPGTYASFPAGPDGTHGVHNTGDEPLRYLAMSTMVDPDVLVYPDSSKVGVVVGAPPGGDEDERTLTKYFREADEVGYWDGEAADRTDEGGRA